jgi:hypothetical protein
MKKISYLIIMLFFIFGIVGSVSAALVDQGDGTSLDGNLLWYQDLSDFVSGTYGQQVAAINAKSLAGGGWTMATLSEMTQLRANTDAQIQANFLPSWDQSAPFREYYYGRYNSVSGTNSHYYFRLQYDGFNYSYGTLPGVGDMDDNSQSIFIGAWATKVVPIPSAVWLLGSGLIGIVGIRKKFKK